MNSASFTYGVGKSSTSLLAGVKTGRVHLCRVAGNTVWSHVASDALWWDLSRSELYAPFYYFYYLLLLLTNRLTWRIVRKLQGHVTNKKKKTATCSVDGSTVEVSAISTTSQTSASLSVAWKSTVTSLTWQTTVGFLDNYVIITAARPAYAGTEGCFVLLAFFYLFFI